VSDFSQYNSLSFYAWKNTGDAQLADLSLNPLVFEEEGCLLISQNE